MPRYGLISNKSHPVLSQGQSEVVGVRMRAVIGSQKPREVKVGVEGRVGVVVLLVEDAANLEK